MGSLSLRVRYRPVRIGWCVERQRLDQLHRAVSLTSTLAGGRFNPVIPVDDPELAEHLIDRFRVDLLYPIAETDPIASFVSAHDYLPWPTAEHRLFYEQWQHMPPHAVFADVHNATRWLKKMPRSKRKLLVPRWQEDDPLAFIFLTLLGRYPEPSSLIPHYERTLSDWFGAAPLVLRPADPLPPIPGAHLTALRVTAVGLSADERGPDDGVYVGDADNFDDLVNFWNLRAAGAGLIFYDPRHSSRLTRVLDSHRSWLATLPQRPWQRDGAISIYRRESVCDDPVPVSLGRVISHSVGPINWNGLNIRPALHYWREQPVLGSVEELDRRPSLTFALPPTPLLDHPLVAQQYIGITVRGSDPWTFQGTATFFPPYIPELNDYYGRELHFDYSRVRCEPPSIFRAVGILGQASDSTVTLRALPTGELAAKLFDRFGIHATPSPAGQVTSRLIAQMDGLQGCRVFKIEGVRALISKHQPDQSFTRSGAVTTIGDADPATNRPRFAAYENLFIAPRSSGKKKLTPQDVLDHLLERGVLRVGLELTCLHCALRFWVSLDDARTEARCEYCGETFSISRQLRDRDWAYRRSGLFGRNDHQQGGIPVAVTLQQLDTELSTGGMLHTPCLELSPAHAQIDRCETDFVVIANGYSHDVPHRPQVVISECKAAGGTITPEDARHLAKVADALPHRRVKVFIVFAKTGTFSAAEVDACRLAQGKWRERVILLSKDELEPYRVTERHPGMGGHLHGLEGLASLTVQLHPSLRCDGPQEVERRAGHGWIQRRAHQFFDERGREPGRDWEDWFRAEDELGPRG